MNHGHGYIRLRFGALGGLLYLVTGKLHLPRLWLFESGELPCDPECTPAEAVLR